MHRVAADVIAALGAVQRRGLGQHAGAGLRGVVGRHVVAGDDARDRGNDDDRAGCMLAHPRQAVLDAEEGAVEVDAVHEAPLLHRNVFHALQYADAGRMHHDIQLAEGGFGHVQCRDPLLLAGDVEIDRDGRLANFLGNLARALEVPVGNDNLRAFLCHQHGGGPAEPRGSAGNQRDFVGYAARHVRFLLLLLSDQSGSSSLAGSPASTSAFSSSSRWARSRASTTNSISVDLADASVNSRWCATSTMLTPAWPITPDAFASRPGASSVMTMMRARRPSRTSPRISTDASRRVSTLPPEITMPTWRSLNRSGLAIRAARPAAPAP